MNEFSEKNIVAWLERNRLREAVETFHESCGKILETGSGESQQCMDVVLCTRLPEQWIGATFACIVMGQRVWFASPLWKDAEWKQVGSIVQPQLILGADALRAIPDDEDNESASASKEPGLMIPTGGSSGNIKFAWHTSETLTRAASGMSRFFFGRAMRKGDFSYRCELPLWHISGWMQVMRAFLSDSVWMHEQSPEEVAKSDEGTWWLSLVPTQLARLLESGKLRDVREADFAVIGGGACPEHLLREAIRNKLTLWVTYGMTETAAMIAGKCIQTEADLELGADVFPHCSLSLRPVSGLSGEEDIGEVCIKAESMCIGYNGERFQKDEDSWVFTTGDLGYFDGAKRLHLKGRLDTLLNTGGEKVFPFEVQRVICEYPGISDCRVFGIDDAEWGCKIACVFTVAGDRLIPVEELKAFLGSRLSAYKVPKIWRQVDSIPYDGKGKIKPSSLVAVLSGEAEKS